MRRRRGPPPPLFESMSELVKLGLSFCEQTKLVTSPHLMSTFGIFTREEMKAADLVIWQLDGVGWQLIKS